MRPALALTSLAVPVHDGGRALQRLTVGCRTGRARYLAAAAEWGIRAVLSGGAGAWREPQPRTAVREVTVHLLRESSSMQLLRFQCWLRLQAKQSQSGAAHLLRRHRHVEASRSGYVRHAGNDGLGLQTAGRWAAEWAAGQTTRPATCHIGRRAHPKEPTKLPACRAAGRQPRNR